MGQRRKPNWFLTLFDTKSSVGFVQLQKLQGEKNQAALGPKFFDIKIL